MGKAYSIRFDFDCEGEPPTVFIVAPNGKEIIEVFEEPTLRPEVEADFSWEDVDWQVGPFTAILIDLLNMSQNS